MNGYFLRLEALFRVFDNHLWHFLWYYTRYAPTPDYQYGIYGVLAIPVFFLTNLSVASTGEAAGTDLPSPLLDEKHACLPFLVP